MKMDFTEEEYRTLVEALELANWMLHAHAEEERKDTERFRDLEQKVLSSAKEFGAGDDITYDKKLEEYYPSREIEDNCLAYVDDYNNNTFWDELIERFVARDLIRQEGEETYYEMPFDQKLEKEEPVRIQYEAEFENHGLDRLVIKP